MIKTPLHLILVGTVRCAVPVAERRVRRRNRTHPSLPLYIMRHLITLSLLFACSFSALSAAEDERPIVDAPPKSPSKRSPNAALPTFHVVGDSTVARQRRHRCRPLGLGRTHHAFFRHEQNERHQPRHWRTERPDVLYGRPLGQGRRPDQAWRFRDRPVRSQRSGPNRQS